MAGNKCVEVVARGADPRTGWIRFDASTADIASHNLSAADDVSVVCAVLDDANADHEQLVALVSVLVVDGVRCFHTSRPQAITRIFDTYAAISAGEIEVLQS